MQGYSRVAEWMLYQIEGGDKLVTDEGGLTKFGVSQRAYPNLDIAALTYADAAALFEKDYWRPLGCHILPAMIAVPIFDCAINQGQRVAGRFLQRAVGVPTRDVDGIVGPQTLAIAAGVAPARHRFVAVDIQERRLRRYEETAGYERNGHSWRNRVLMSTLLGALWTDGDMR